MYVPGLTDGLLSVGYIPALAAAMDRLGYSFVQPVLSSSYKGTYWLLGAMIRYDIFVQLSILLCATACCSTRKLSWSLLFFFLCVLGSGFVFGGVFGVC